MELRQIRYFVAIAREGSFGRAADELHVTKSAISRQVRQLEAELGAELFVRGGGRREVSLTEAGDAFLPEAVTILEAADQGTARVRDLGGPQQGQANLVVEEGWDSWPGWEALVTEFRRQHPGVGLNLEQARSAAAMLELVASGAADVAILSVVEPPDAQGVRVELLHTEELHAAIPLAHRLAGRERIELAELRDETWLLQPMARDILREVAGWEPRVAMEAPSTALIRSRVLAGEGLALLGQSEVDYYSPAATAAVGDPPIEWSIAIAYRSAYRGAATRVVRDFMRAQFAGAQPAA